MKILDLFCGLGGWSIPFVEDGDYVIGIDIVKADYPGELIIQDVKTVDGNRFKDFDFIIGSPPCRDFTTWRFANTWKIPGDPLRGLILVDHFLRIVKEAKPRFWAFENVYGIEKYIPFRPIWKFKISKLGWRVLYGNIPIGLTIDYKNERIMDDYRNLPKLLSSRLKAKIPYEIARVIKNSVCSTTY